MVLIAALLSIGLATQADRWVLNPSEVVRKASAFELLISADGKYALQQGAEGAKVVPVDGGVLGPNFSIRPFRDPQSGKVIFFSSFQAVPAAIAAHPASDVKVDFAWSLSSNRSAVFSAHLEAPPKNGEDTMYMIVLDFAARGSTPLHAGALHQVSQWGLSPLAVRATAKTVSWWVQKPGKGGHDSLCKCMLNLNTDRVGEVTVCAMPDLRYTLYYPETGLAADYNSLFHVVTTWQRGRAQPFVIHSPPDTMGFCVTQKGVLLPIGDKKGEIKSASRLVGGKWVSRGAIAVLGLDAAGRVCLVKDLKTQRISERQE